METDFDSDIEPEPTETYIASLSHTNSVQIEFENESTISIYCYWIQYDCNIRKPPHIIHPLSSLRLNTYSTHPFILSTCDSLNAYNYDTIIAVYIPTNTKYLIHHLIIHEDLKTVSIDPFHEEIKPRCKCGSLLLSTSITNDDDDGDHICFGCHRYISIGDVIWKCENVECHQNKEAKIYCLGCSQQRSQPLAIIHGYASDINNNDYCCNKKLKKYPINYPKTFKFHQFIENWLRILSLSSDLILIYLLIKKNFVSNLGNIKLSNIEIVRTIFTFLPGFFLCILLFILYTICKHDIDDGNEYESKRKECLKTICVSLVVLSLIFLYKVLMILVCIYRIYFILKRVQNSKKLSSDVEIKHIIFLYPLLYNTVLSSWPLFIISFIEIITNFNNNLLNNIQFIVLFTKIISDGILIFSDIDRLRFWRNSIYDPKILIPVCILHTTRPYPMRIVKVTFNDDDDDNNNCIMCNETVVDTYIYHCAHSKCNDNFIICMECGWNYLTKYQQHININDKEFYQQLIISSQFMKLYGERINHYAERNNLQNVSKQICWIKWFIKFLYNLFQFFILIIGIIGLYYCCFQEIIMNGFID